MKHAGTYALRQLSNLLDQIRRRPGIQEKRLGVFYRKSRSFLHFHEDPDGIFADMSKGSDFDRYPVNTIKQRKVLLAAIDQALDTAHADDRAR